MQSPMRLPAMRVIATNKFYKEERALHRMLKKRQHRDAENLTVFE